MTTCVEFEMADKYHLTFMDEGILELYLKNAGTYLDSTLLNVTNVLTKLATKSINILLTYSIEECMAKLLQLNALGRVLELFTAKAQDPNTDDSLILEF
jgi:hypothetical protein